MISNASANGAQFLLDASLKSFIVLALAGAIVLCSRRLAAAARHSIWFAATASLLFLPFFSLIVPGWQKPVWTISTSLKSGNELTLALEFPVLNASRVSATVDKNRDPSRIIEKSPAANRGPITARLHTRWLIIAPGIWLAGALVLLACTALGYLRLYGIRSTAQPSALAAPLLSELSHELSIGRSTQLLESERNLMPSTWGWRRPVVLLPADAAQWTPERQRIVLRHELAHVKRWDCLSQFITQIVCALYWFNPLVWLAARQMRVERERACDDLVLEAGCKASDYASHLLEIARSFRHMPQVAAIAMARSSQLENRITAIVDNSRARRAPRMFVLSLLWAVMLSLVATIAAQKASDSEIKSLHQKQIARLQAFSDAKEKQSRALAAKAEGEISPEYRKFFDAAIKGDGQTVTNMYDSFKRRHTQYGGHEETLRTSYWSPVLEISMAYYDIMAGEPKYIQMAVDDIVGTIPRGSIYFGGTDPGRALPTAFCASHPDGDPFFTLTQNALADGGYLEYLRKMYGGKIYTPTEDDNQKCFQDYTRDAQQRLQHDSKFPNEPRQIKPGEDVRLVDNKVNVRGQVAVMAINGMLCKIIFDKNPNREFYIEESFPLDWMYPYLEPHGLIMKINRQPLDALPEETLERDHKFWQSRVHGMLGNWLTEDTSVEAIADFAETVYARKDLSGFKGDPRFVQNDNPQRMLSKWRSSIAGVYTWRILNLKSPESKSRMTKEADFAFRQAFALCPASPEPLFRYVNLLISTGRIDDAIRLTTAAIAVSPDSQRQNLLAELQRIKSSQQK
ncbi:MAG TPA: M56 family metallopeptidase [Verrucomicrobiae bacterium]|nr:M56 family metallopeptidase [Verrucomicrobiae bacterium]